MVDPISLILIGIGVSAVIVLKFWNQILRWSSDILFPWVEKYMPGAIKDVRLAFDAVDKVATPLRRAVKQAWQGVRNYLLKQVMDFSRKTSTLNSYAWIRKTTTWLIRALESGERVPVKVETTSTVEWEEVPDDVREEFLRRNKLKGSVDVTELRDKELEQVEVVG
jgi:hypothetical protein